MYRPKAPPHCRVSLTGNAAIPNEVAEHLITLLKETHILCRESLSCHWLVTGPDFSGLHYLFEQHYQALRMAVDAIAERIHTLGYAIPHLSADSSETDSSASTSEEMIAKLIRGHETCSSEAREVFNAAESAHDETSADLMVQRMIYHDKAAWMLHDLQDNSLLVPQ